MLEHAIRFVLAVTIVSSALIFLTPTAPSATTVVVLMTLGAFGAGHYARHRSWG